MPLLTKVDFECLTIVGKVWVEAVVVFEFEVGCFT
jgi:hypothetical protein